MTDNATAEPKYVVVQPDAGSRLEQLHAAYESAKAEADGAAERLKAITDGIKLELAKAAPEQPFVELVGPAGVVLQLTWSESWRVDSRKLKAEDPETYVRYAKKSGSWSLRRAGGRS